MASKALTVKERKFVDMFMGKAAGNATKAAVLAGYSEKTAGQIGYHQLKKVQIQKAIHERGQREERQAIAGADERDELMSSFLRDPEVSPVVKIKAASEMNKCEGRHAVKHEHAGNVQVNVAMGWPPAGGSNVG